MTHPLIPMLNREVDQLDESLERHPVASRLYDGTISLADYGAFLIQTFHTVRWTSPLLARAGQRLREAGRAPAVAGALGRKAAEEVGHEQWALADLKELGFGPEAVQGSAPSLAVSAYIAWNRYTAEEGPPLALLGTAYVLEGLSVRRAPAVVDALLTRGAIPRIDRAVSFLKGHGEADGDHLAQLAAFLASVAEEAECEAVVHSARTTRLLYGGLFPTAGAAQPSPSQS